MRTVAASMRGSAPGACSRTGMVLSKSGASRSSSSCAMAGARSQRRRQLSTCEPRRQCCREIKPVFSCFYECVRTAQAAAARARLPTVAQRVILRHGVNAVLKHVVTFTTAQRSSSKLARWLADLLLL